MLWMNKVTIASSFALTFIVLSALSLPEVCDWAIFNMYLNHIVEFSIHSFETFFGLLLLSKFYVNIAHHMLANIISHDYV